MQIITDRQPHIPVINISNANAQTGDQLIEAVANCGFVYIKGEGSGFTSEVINQAFEMV